MNPTELKNKMMNLWKSVFHDSDAYISLMFDTYFNPDLTVYHEVDNDIVSALLGIPYTFNFGDTKLTGLYLCGLATQENFRGQGIMTKLIKEINKKASERGYSFTFLIPASDSLINYYSEHGYHEAIYRVEERYTCIHDFDMEYRSILSKESDTIRGIKERYYDNLRVKTYDKNISNIDNKIIQYITSNESKEKTYIELKHSSKDIQAIITENIISKGDIIICYTSDNRISGIAFVIRINLNQIVIPKLYFDNRCSFFKILDFVKKMYQDSSLSVYLYPEETYRKALWSKIYISDATDFEIGTTEQVYNVKSLAKTYGMIRVLNYSEILKFTAKYKPDLKFSILIKGYFGNRNALLCNIQNGNSCFSELAEPERDDTNADISVLTPQELSNLLFRKKDNNNLIFEAFGIPRLAINMTLMLD